MNKLEIFIATDPDDKVKLFLEPPRREKTYASGTCMEQWIGRGLHVPLSLDWRDLFPSFTFPSWTDEPVRASLVLKQNN